MPEDAAIWDLYWEVHLRVIEDLGKRAAILAASQLIRSLSERSNQPVRLLELGCGAGQVIGSLAEAHAQVNGIQRSLGIDRSRQLVEGCRRAYPEISFIECDFTDQARLAELGQFEIVLLVNALHEVFSVVYSLELGEIAVPQAKAQVERTLASAAACLAPGGHLILFDGLEASGDVQRRLLIRFQSWQARRRFEMFAREYRPFRIAYHNSNDPFQVELSLRDFTRYITKSIFLGKRLWQTERLESYQYFNENEFRTALEKSGLALNELHTSTVDYEKWRDEVEILSPGVDFPAEHILILAQRPV